MFKFFIVILILITFFLLSLFIDGLMKLNKQEKENTRNIVREGIEGYLDQTFGIGTVEIFKSILDAEGNLGYKVYMPHYEWFKSPKYQWFEVYATNQGFHHSEIKE